MTEILFHAAQRRAHSLGTRLREVMGGINHPGASHLADRILTGTHQRPLLVFTGQWSSGKSTLINALTDGAAGAAVGSGIVTGTVDEYNWDGLVRLVDTPGVHSGIDLHDTLAEEAIASADLVLFTVTVDLFDDAGIAHLQHVTADLGKEDQLLLVITKANTMRAEAEIRGASIGEALGPNHPTIPFIECDAGDYNDGLTHRDPARGQAYREMSNIDAVRVAINEISARRGDLARYQQPFQVIKAVALDAEALVTVDPNEEAVLALLARQRSALTARRERIEAKLEGLASTFRTESVLAAETFADRVEALDSEPDGPTRQKRIDEITNQLTEDLTYAADRLGENIERILESQFNDFADEVLEIQASRHARVVLDLDPQGGAPAMDTEVSVQGRLRQMSASSGAVPAWAGEAGQWLRKFQSTWGAGGGVRASAGSPGHLVVLKVGHALGKKFKPWEAVRVANNIGKAAKIGGTALPFIAALGGTVLEDRAEQRAEQERVRRRRGLVNEVVNQAKTIAAQAMSEVRGPLDQTFRDAYAEIDAVHGNITAARGDRSALQASLTEIQTGADEGIADLIAAHRRGDAATPLNFG